MNNQASNPPKNVVLQVMIPFLVEKLRSTQLALVDARGEIAEKDAAIVVLTAALRNHTTETQQLNQPLRRNVVQRRRDVFEGLKRRDMKIKRLERQRYACLAVMVMVGIVEWGIVWWYNR